MRIKLISCEVFFREVCHSASLSNNIIDVSFIPFGLHNTPDQLREYLQREIDLIEADKYDYAVLAYGLCSGGTAGLTARNVPLVLPRAHDCITLFLGSRTRYDSEFSSHPGTYYYTPGWIERADGQTDQGQIVELKERERARRFEEYKEKYGEDNAAYLIEQESQWLANYNRAALIQTGLGDIESYRDFTKRVAASRGWDYEEIQGDMSLVEKLVAGMWSDKDFLIVSPGRSVLQSFDESVVRLG